MNVYNEFYDFFEGGKGFPNLKGIRLKEKGYKQTFGRSDCRTTFWIFCLVLKQKCKECGIVLRLVSHVYASSKMHNVNPLRIM